MSESSLKRDTLHNLVEGTFLAHKQDIHDYASGHLNPSKLRKLPGHNTSKVHVPWKSADILKPKNRDLESPHSRATQSRNTADEILVDKLGLMKNALLDFSMGTTGSLSSHKNVASKRHTKGRKKKATAASRCTSKLLHSSKSEAKLEAMVMSEITKLMIDQEEPFTSSESLNANEQSHQATVNKKFVLQYPLHQSSFIEEIKLPEIMLPAVDESARVPLSLKDPQIGIKQRVNQITDKKFVTTHLAGITRKDQFNKILDLDRNVLHRYETMERKVRDGHKAVEHLEQKLVRNLLEMNIRDPPVHGLNFERLQVYGEIWQDLCDDSSIVGPVLTQLKEQYDLYLSGLLDEMKSANHAELVSCFNNVGENSHMHDDKVEELRETVENMEENSRQLLLRNADLQDEIRREKERIEEERRLKEQEEEDNRRRMIPNKVASKKSVTQNTEKNVKNKREEVTEVVLKRFRVDIWEKLDMIEKLQKELKTGYVPKTVYRNYQHAVKDTEGDMQKIMQQNEYLTKNITSQEDLLEGELSQDLNDVLDSLGLSK